MAEEKAEKRATTKAWKIIMSEKRKKAKEKKGVRARGFIFKLYYKTRTPIYNAPAFHFIYFVVVGRGKQFSRKCFAELFSGNIYAR